MDQRRDELEYDEFEKLLGEIPNVTSEKNNLMPVSGRFQNSLSLDYRGMSAMNKGEQLLIKTAHHEESNLPEDFTPWPEDSHLPLPNSFSLGFDKFDARKHDPQMFPRMQQLGYFQNFSSGLPPVHALQSVQLCGNMQLPEEQFMSRNLPLNQSRMNWGNIEEEQLQRLRLSQEHPYSSMKPHFLYLYDQSMDARNKIMDPVMDSHHAENQRSRGYPDMMLMRAQLGLNAAKAMQYGLRDESKNIIKHNERLWLHNQIDDSISRDFHAAMNIKSSDLRVLPRKYNSIEEARGNIYYMAKDQHGCRVLQRKFTERNEEDTEMIFSEIIDHITELMTDPFGNYLVQKLLEVCSEDQRFKIVHSVTRKPGELIRISCDMHGTRAIQKIVETVKAPDQISMVLSAMKPGIVIMIKNVNGNHVAQRCLQYILPQSGKILFEAAITHCVELATDRHGCCVLQKCLGLCEGEERNLLISEVISNALLLAQDPFGNYVLQFVFGLKLQWANLKILEELEGNFTHLSMQKCSSNVVEKCLNQVDDEHRSAIIRELINDGRLDQVMQSPYGNYVIQAALKQSRRNIHAVLVDAIKPHIVCLRNNPYGKKVLSALSLKK